jgi:hypothetical protein
MNKSTGTLLRNRSVRIITKNGRMTILGVMAISFNSDAFDFTVSLPAGFILARWLIGACVRQRARFTMRANLNTSAASSYGICVPPRRKNHGVASLP